jgi:hypothetical protein
LVDFGELEKELSDFEPGFDELEKDLSDFGLDFGPEFVDFGPDLD